MENDCIFCKIIAGTLPCSKVYEDDAVIAFMDINPINEGHTLIVPKQHFAELHEMPETLATQLFKVALRVEKAVRNIEIECEGTNLIQNNGKVAGQDVHHVHFHVIPRRKQDTFRFKIEPLKIERKRLQEIAASLAANL